MRFISLLAGTMALSFGIVPFAYAADQKSGQERHTRQIASEMSVPEPGSVESLETSKPAKPRDSHSTDAVRSTRPLYPPSQTTVPGERTRALEERLRRGQMDRPVAQGQVSDRLEQMHSGGIETPTGHTDTGQSAQ
jgi:hypothetical protein